MPCGSGVGCYYTGLSRSIPIQDLVNIHIYGIRYYRLITTAGGGCTVYIDMGSSSCDTTYM